MRSIRACAPVAGILGMFGVVFAACGPRPDPSQQQAAAPTAQPYAYPQQQPQQGYPPGSYPQQQQPQGYPPGSYPQQAPYPAPTATYAAPPPQPTAPPAYTSPAPPPASPAPAPSGSAMAVPGPAALPCQNDIQCFTHHCNTQYGKCAFPCQSNNDCIAPNTCCAAGSTNCLPGVCWLPFPASTPSTAPSH